MTKAELLHFLEPFADQIEVRVSAGHRAQMIMVARYRLKDGHGMVILSASEDEPDGLTTPHVDESEDTP